MTERTPHLRREERRAEILKLLARLPGATSRELSSRIGMSPNATGQLLREMRDAAQVKADPSEDGLQWRLA